MSILNNLLFNMFNLNLVLISLKLLLVFGEPTMDPSMMECEFPPRAEEDLTYIRRKRLTTDTGLVCLEDYPYTVSIRLHERHWCGGAIIDKQWVISAAQNFDYVTKDEITVRMGSVYRDYGGNIHSVIDIVRHPQYKLSQYYPDHNIALVKLNIPIIKSPRIQVVSLASANEELPKRFGETVVTGYGAVKSGPIHEGKNQELRRMIVKEVKKSDCRLIYGNDYQLQHDHMCLQSTAKHIALCAGDTGDPAVFFTGTKRSGTLFGIAIFSGTEECASKEKPGVFAKVSACREWIDAVVSDNLTVLQAPDSVQSKESVE